MREGGIEPPPHRHAAGSVCRGTICVKAVAWRCRQSMGSIKSNARDPTSRCHVYYLVKVVLSAFLIVLVSEVENAIPWPER